MKKIKELFQKFTNLSFQKKVIIYLVAFFICVALGICLIVAFQADEPKELNYLDFQTNLSEENVEHVTIYTNLSYFEVKLKSEDVIYRTTYPYSEDFIENLLLTGIDVEVTAKNAFSLASIITPIYSIVLIILMILLAYKLSGSMSSFSTDIEKDVNITFKDVAGMSELKEELMTIADFMNGDKYTKAGAVLPKGILLYGPPGNGKTYIARAFAGELQSNFIAINASDFESSFVGIGSSRIKKLFNDAYKNRPCVVFIDELDSFGSTRYNGGDSASKEFNTILTTLLDCMDGFDKMDGVMVLAATNRVDSLDPALLRPGRFDKKFAVSLPDRETRKALFDFYLSKQKLSNDVDIDKLVNLTYMSCSAAIANIVNEAIIKMVKANDKEMHSVYLEDAITEQLLNGKTKKDVTEDEKRIKKVVAYHESGHAVIGTLLCEKKISKISILPTTSGAGGYTMFEEDSDNNMPTLKEMRNEIMELYGGRAAEYILGGETLDNVSTGATNDVKRATELAVQYVYTLNGFDYSLFGESTQEDISGAAKDLLINVWKETIVYLNRNWDKVEELANTLMEYEELTM